MTDLSTLPDRALSIRQPWAWAILNAGKDIENRSWRTHYRGRICIHAGSAIQPRNLAEFKWILPDVIAWHHHAATSTKEAKTPPPTMEDLWPSQRFFIDQPRGGIIGTAEIVDCVDHSDSPWFTGPYGFVLANVQPVPFIPVKGAQGMFKWKKKLESQHG
jgi:hypothetical protein